MSVTRRLAAFCAQLDSADLPRPVAERVPALLLDLAGCIVRASVDAPAAPSLFQAAEALGLGHGTLGVLGSGRRYGPAGAAFLNASLGHALDFDDTHAPGTLHPGAAVIPAALAAGELSAASGAEVLAGIVAGYEAACRIAVALPAAAHYRRGFHPTATCGVFGAAAAAARVFRLPAERIEAAFGVALSQSAGSLQFLVDGAWTKPFQVGWAAMGGLAAATLAREGFRGPAEALEGAHGFLRAYGDGAQPEQVAAGLGERWETLRTGVKPYPSCRYGHAAIDAALLLRRDHQLEPGEIDGVTCGLSEAGLLLIGAPAALKQNPQNTVGAQFSGPFVLSAALVDGAVTWDSYARLQDPAIRRLMPKVDCVHDPEIEAEFPANMSGAVTIAARGTTFHRKIVTPFGEPDNFPSRGLLVGKFESLAVPVLGPGGAQALAAAALDLESLEDIRALSNPAQSVQ